jgi:hypothetical protein
VGRADYFARGAWNFICDCCGAKYKSFDARKQWDFQIVCPTCWEPRNPQDFIKAIPEKPIPWSRPDQPICDEEVVVTCGRWLDDCFVLDGTWLG